MVKPKAKGNKWENFIYDDIRKLGYWIRKQKGSGCADDNKGDLETYNLLIECKHHKKVSDKQISFWMNKIYEEALAEKKNPLLIIKINYKPAMVYYIGEDSSIKSLSYDIWKKLCLPYEKQPLEQFIKEEKRKNLPKYIG